MKLHFDYLQGPVLGHKRRCEILVKTAMSMNHQIVGHPCLADWIIVDYPNNQLPVWNGYSRRLVMGVLPQNKYDYAWHALGSCASHTLCGKEYLILDPKLEDYKTDDKRDWFFVACGGADPLKLTPQILSILPRDITEYYNTVVIGPNFGYDIVVPEGYKILHAPQPDIMLHTMAQHRNVICAWGNTAFEASYLGCRVFAIPTCEEHIAEIKRFGLEPVLPTELATLSERLKEPIKRVEIDLNGAKRILHWLAKISGEYARC